MHATSPSGTAAVATRARPAAITPPASGRPSRVNRAANKARARAGDAADGHDQEGR